MKKIISVCICIILLFGVNPISVHAYEQEQLLSHEITKLENGITIIDEVFQVSTIRSTTKTYTWRKTVKDDGTTIAVIAITGVFDYTGTTVSVVSKSVTQTNTYEGWNYKQNSFTSSGGTITLNAKLTKLLVMNIPFTMTLSCDKNGNISYT